MKNKKSKIVVTAAAGALIAAVIGVYVWQQFPALLPAPPDADASSGAAAQSEETRETLNHERFYLPIEEQSWLSPDEELNWNGKLLFTLNEPPAVSKERPAGFSAEDFYYLDKAFYENAKFPEENVIYEEVDENGTFTSPHLYLTLSYRTECIGLETRPLYGVSGKDVTTYPFAAGNEVLTIYDRSSATIKLPIGLRACTMLVNGREPSGHSSEELKIGDVAQVRAVYILTEEDWKEHAVLLTPHYIYDISAMREYGYSQPHVLLNG